MSVYYKADEKRIPRTRNGRRACGMNNDNEQFGDSAYSTDVRLPMTRPVVGANGEWEGKTWRDMPARSEFEKRLQFSFFRRGITSVGDCLGAPIPH